MYCILKQMQIFREIKPNFLGNIYEVEFWGKFRCSYKKGVSAYNHCMRRSVFQIMEGLID